MSFIREDECLDSTDYVEEVTGNKPCQNVTLEECEKILEEDEICLWNYPLTEIEHIIEMKLNVVLVRFPNEYGGYDYRFCEI